MAGSCCNHDTPQKINAAAMHPEADGGHGGHGYGNAGDWHAYVPAGVSALFLLAGIVLDIIYGDGGFKGLPRFLWYALAYLPVGWGVLKEAFGGVKNKDFFNEFSLMGLATLGAFAIGEYPEGVAVMLFYAVGELFQGAAVKRAKGNIQALLDVRPDSANVLRDGAYQVLSPEAVGIGETIQIKVGEKVPLDGEILNASSSFNTSALTGESRPKSLSRGDTVLAGMVNLDKVVELRVTKKFADSSLARILELVQNASTRKAKTELMMRRFAKIYTPIVFFLALALTVLPYFIVQDYVFSEWLYRALVFLVISCPCALVISIPLGYFGGIGAASRNGILFKGGNFLDVMAKVNTVVMDKTGTLTEGVFKVQVVHAVDGNPAQLLYLLNAIEQQSNHPIAKAIVEHVGKKNTSDVTDSVFNATNVEETSGHGLKGMVNGQEVLAGNTKLLHKFNVQYDPTIDSIVETIVVLAVNQQYAGYVLIADAVKADATQAIKNMHREGVTQTVMLSGDKNAITQSVAQRIGIDSAFGDLLPENKVEHVERIKQDTSKVVAFVGDGINDAPVLALSDVGIAMGGMGSDAAIETADVIIQTDQPRKIATAIQIGKATRRIVWQNIALAFAVKAMVLMLGAGGLATMWEAVFADVGVALLAILNAVRIQRMRFDSADDKYMNH
ncbi:MAG: heavy metal translocating P-type ATPase [Formosimonas sp.]